MKPQSTIKTSTVGLAIFSMMFGAGNIIYPIKAGVIAGSNVYPGLFGFLLSGIVLPMLGLITMILFDGNYQSFFAEIGKVPGFLASLYCMLILGPLLVMPRCITVPYDIMGSFLPDIGLPVFSMLLASTAVIITYKNAQLIDFFGKYVSWILLGSFGIIIGLGLQNAPVTTPQTGPLNAILIDQFLQGFKTLDLIGALFFAATIIRLIKHKTVHNPISPKRIMVICLQGSLIAGTFMALLYTGFGLLGSHYRDLVAPSMNGAEMFRIISFEIIGHRAVLLLIGTILLTSLSTLIALTTVFSEYMRTNLVDKKLTSTQCTIITVALTVIISNFGLSNILTWSNPFVDFGYPIIITLTICNLLKKLFDFQYVKIPVYFVTLIMVFISYLSYCS